MSRKSFQAGMEQRLRDSEIIPELPCVLGSPEPLPGGINGAIITAIGSIAEENSGLVIEYREESSGTCRRVLLRFSDTGMSTIASVQI